MNRLEATSNGSVLVDGRDICELIRAAERSGPTVMGKMALARQRDHAYIATISKRSYLDLPAWRARPQEAELVCCSCRVSGCASGTVRVQVLDAVVVWDNFTLNAQPLDLGPFEFD